MSTSGYFARLAARSTQPTTGLRPRRLSLYEQPPSSALNASRPEPGSAILAPPRRSAPPAPADRARETPEPADAPTARAAAAAAPSALAPPTNRDVPPAGPTVDQPSIEPGVPQDPTGLHADEPSPQAPRPEPPRPHSPLTPRRLPETALAGERRNGDGDRTGAEAKAPARTPAVTSPADSVAVPALSHVSTTEDMRPTSAEAAAHPASRDGEPDAVVQLRPADVPQPPDPPRLPQLHPRVRLEPPGTPAPQVTVTIGRIEVLPPAPPPRPSEPAPPARAPTAPALADYLRERSGR